LPLRLTKPQITILFYLARLVVVIRNKSCKRLRARPKQSVFEENLACL